MNRLYFYDDARARTFEPFVLTRPASELTCGAVLTRMRWERATGTKATGFIASPLLADFEEFDAPPSIAENAVLEAGAIVVNSRCVISLDEVLANDQNVWICEGIVCAVRLSRPVAVSDFVNGDVELDIFNIDLYGAPHEPRRLHGRWMREVWDYLAHLTPQLSDDIAALTQTVTSSSMLYDAVIGEHGIVIEDGAKIEPYVLFDTTAGPVMVRSGATISAFSRIVGPCYIDHDATVLGEMVANCSIGPFSKIRGEIHSSIVLGYSNKGHSGFVGHSYLGRWVNLGAGTTTSNLKNTYGTVQLWTPSGVRNTEQQFLGTLFGDHAKTGIGTMLNTGTVLSVGANVYGGNMPAKYVPPFAWGDSEPYGSFAIDKFIEVATRVMRRRNVQISGRQESQLRTVYAERK